MKIQNEVFTEETGIKIHQQCLKRNEASGWPWKIKFYRTLILSWGIKITISW